MQKALPICLFALLLAGCSAVSPLLNKPLKAMATPTGSLPPVSHPGRDDDLALILTFSGGGTRAAALSYGVMQELNNTPIQTHGQEHSLLDETDLISSVSGGSFTAAYFGLHGKRIFNDYEQRFLKQTVQRRLIKSLLKPKNWLKLAPGLYNRGDLAADYFENSIFGGKQFRDMRKDGPRIVINATDLSTGTAFPFTEESFRWLCSSLGEYPVGRAVAASAAVPVLFSSITLRNYPGCQPYPHQDGTQATEFLQYLRKDQYPYLHLVDGGVSDNLGIRSLLHVVEGQNGNFWDIMQTYGMANTHRVAFIVVNAAPAIPSHIARYRSDPSVSATLSAVTTIQSRRYNQDTLGLLANRFGEWEKQVKTGRCQTSSTPDCADINFYLAELNFRQLPPAQAQRLEQLGTSLELPAAQVDELIAAGRSLLRHSPQFQQLVADLRANGKPAANKR